MIEEYLFPCVNFMYKNMSHHNWSGNKGFEPSEVEKFRRIFLDVVHRQRKIEAGDQELKREQEIARARFPKFLFEYDRRRFLKFYEVFPEYVDFYKRCSEIEI